jgi:putative ubiquitin-RnfH superfamily antitoxin RatB of RatAB toxin-antitoxin module
MANPEIIEVALAYAKPEHQIVLPLKVPLGATLGEAIAISGITKRFPGIDLLKNKTGVFGRLRPLEYILRPGDRVEIYRPLVADPKEVRRARVRGEGGPSKRITPK